MDLPPAVPPSPALEAEYQALWGRSVAAGGGVRDYGDALKAFAQGGAQAGPYSATFAQQTGWPLPGALPPGPAAGWGAAPSPAGGYPAFGPGAAPPPFVGPQPGGAIPSGLPGFPQGGGPPAGYGIGHPPQRLPLAALLV